MTLYQNLISILKIKGVTETIETTAICLGYIGIMALNATDDIQFILYILLDVWLYSMLIRLENSKMRSGLYTAGVILFHWFVVAWS